MIPPSVIPLIAVSLKQASIKACSLWLVACSQISPDSTESEIPEIKNGIRNDAVMFSISSPLTVQITDAHENL